MENIMADILRMENVWRGGGERGSKDWDKIFKTETKSSLQSFPFESNFLPKSEDNEQAKVPPNASC